MFNIGRGNNLDNQHQHDNFDEISADFSSD